MLACFACHLWPFWNHHHKWWLCQQPIATAAYGSEGNLAAQAGSGRNVGRNRVVFLWGGGRWKAEWVGGVDLSCSSMHQNPISSPSPLTSLVLCQQHGPEMWNWWEWWTKAVISKLCAVAPEDARMNSQRHLRMSLVTSYSCPGCHHFGLWEILCLFLWDLIRCKIAT